MNVWTCKRQYSFAKDELDSAAAAHPVYRTPYNSLLYAMIWRFVLVFSGSFDVLTDLVVFGTFTFYILLAIGLIKMKRKGVNKEKIPAYPPAPISFSLFILVMLVSTFITLCES